MLCIHGSVKVEKVEEIRQISFEPGMERWVINMVVITMQERKSGTPRFDSYEASMFFNKLVQAQAWHEQLVPNRIIEIKYAELAGLQKAPDGTNKGWIKIIMEPSPKLTILKDIRDG